MRMRNQTKKKINAKTKKAAPTPRSARAAGLLQEGDSVAKKSLWHLRHSVAV
jgi:hypothetical protein